MIAREELLTRFLLYALGAALDRLNGQLTLQITDGRGDPPMLELAVDEGDIVLRRCTDPAMVGLNGLAVRVAEGDVEAVREFIAAGERGK
jgi:hypothetical protein